MSGELGSCDAAAAAGWAWFRRKLLAGDWSPEDLEPLREELRGPLLQVLGLLRGLGQESDESVSLQRTLLGPDSLSFLFCIAPARQPFVATVVRGGTGQHRLRQLEGIMLDVPARPVMPYDARELPRLAAETEHWMRGELEMTERVRLFRYLTQEESREFALRWFADGAGYLLAARSWLPYLASGPAFLWYAAWSETHLRGNPVVVHRGGPDGGLLEMTDPLHWRLYRATGHLRQQISEADYEAVFEAVWEDRALHAGYGLSVRRDRGLELGFLRLPD